MNGRDGSDRCGFGGVGEKIGLVGFGGRRWKSLGLKEGVGIGGNNGSARESHSLFLFLSLLFIAFGFEKEDWQRKRARDDSEQ